MSKDRGPFIAVPLPIGRLVVGDLICTVTDSCRADAVVSLRRSDGSVHGDAACPEHLQRVTLIDDVSVAVAASFKVTPAAEVADQMINGNLSAARRLVVMNRTQAEAATFALDVTLVLITTFDVDPIDAVIRMRNVMRGTT